MDRLLQIIGAIAPNAVLVREPEIVLRASPCSRKESNVLTVRAGLIELDRLLKVVGAPASAPLAVASA